MLVTRINILVPHYEKKENLATSVDFRLIQNLLMLIEIKVSLLG